MDIANIRRLRLKPNDILVVKLAGFAPSEVCDRFARDFKAHLSSSGFENEVIAHDRSLSLQVLTKAPERA